MIAQRKVRTAFAAATLVTGLLAGTTATAAAAGSPKEATAGTTAAALPTCTKVKHHNFRWVPAASNGSINCVMGRGSQSAAVKHLQHTMWYCSRYKKNISRDGKFGPKTEAALKSVQRKEGVNDDGVYGPKTRKKMHFPISDGSPGVCGRI
ncbi:peptidoglycan-binding protein [Streptomyces monticola]|uniref:Peptidoglycan-binding protein n=1 Tax=Streptomyces monticola TaxID=2666263 RepID=A0ABW2JM41_9ACTN